MGLDRLGVGETAKSRRKTADTTRTNTSSATDDPHLSGIPVEAGATYLLTAFLPYSSSTTADFKIGWSTPAGSTLAWSSDGPPSSASGVGVTPNRGLSAVASTVTLGGIGAGTGVTARPVGTLTVGGTGGNFGLQWAQGPTPEATDTILYAGAWVRLERVT